MGKSHQTVNYVFKYPYYILYKYHVMIMDNMKERGYIPNKIWYNNTYRGSRIGYDKTKFTLPSEIFLYPEHNHEYYKECIENLKNKGIYV